MKKLIKQPPEAPIIRFNYCPLCNSRSVVSTVQQHPDDTFTLCKHTCDDCGHSAEEFPLSGHQKLSTETVDNL